VNLIELTKKIVNIPSLSGHEGEIADFLCRYLKEKGFDLHEQKIEESRRNILATAGSEPRVILCAHMDTVPPFFPASEDDRYIYGRGACDAKGSMASMIWAAQELKKDGLTEIGLLFIAGEETDSVGAKIANSLNVRSDFIVVGEPTENKLGAGHQGIIVMKIITKGKTAHSAYPQLGESAIEKLLDFLQKIRRLDFAEDPAMGKTHINIGVIGGGEAANVVADSAWAELSIRSSLRSKQILDHIKAQAHQKVEFAVLSQSEPQNLYTVPGFDQVMLPYGTDIPYLYNFGKPLLVGPGSPRVAHTENERIEKRQLAEAAEIYRDLSIKLIAKISTIE
jgi:acetylornithine deacetylase